MEPPKLQTSRWERSHPSSSLEWDTRRPWPIPVHFALLLVVISNPSTNHDALDDPLESANIAVVPSENFLPNALDVGPGEGGLVIRNKEVEV